MKRLFAPLFIYLFLPFTLLAQAKTDSSVTKTKSSQKQHTVLYGQASYYASKFHGRKTANGEIFDHKKMTAACNTLPLGTWVLITNLRNGRTIKVKINDRLHHKTRRLVDLTRAGAQKLGFIKQGLTRVKVEVVQYPAKRKNKAKKAKN